MVTYPRRDEIWLVSMDPAQGGEIQKTRPAMVVSPNEIERAPARSHYRSHDQHRTPLSDSCQHRLPERARLKWLSIGLVRAVDRQRLVRKLGVAPAKAAVGVSTVLVEMFTRR